MTLKTLAASTAVCLTIATHVFACENCGPRAPQTQYQGGGVQMETVEATACFDVNNQVGERFILDAISGSNGPFPYTVDLVYNQDLGTHEVIRTVKNGSPCWTQNVEIGTWMAVYVTCQTYNGWVAVQILSSGTFIMRRVPWTFVENL